MKIIYTTFLALLICLSSVVFAQTTILTGKVINETGEPAAGVTVTVKAAKVITSTSNDGSFSITVSKLPDTLTFTVVGYESAVYQVKEKNSLKAVLVTLHASHSKLEEVVVVGYGTERRRDVTGSITTFSSAAIRGKAAGVSMEKQIAVTGMKQLPELKREAGRSKVLTAGEVSDFKKWKLWADYTETEFKSWSTHWGIAPKERYCVQVQNGEHKAIAAEKVYLIDYKTKDTVWKAVTDNTGKAELWANLYNNEHEKAAYCIACDNQLLTFPTAFENGINRITLHQPCDVSNIVDIAFVVDATGSMGDEIHYLQEELQDIISKTASRYKDVNLQSAAVFYRDHADEYLTRHIDFQTDPLPLIRFIKEQSAAGGGDTPEAVEDALTTALDSLHWTETARTKILFLVLDAPPHDAAKDRMNELIAKAAMKGIRIVPVMCSGIDKSTEYLMRSIALATNGSYVFLTDDSGIGNPHIKPTTDEFTVELLNGLLQRLIGEMMYAPACAENKRAEPVNDLVNNNIIKVVVYPNPTQGIVNIESSALVKEIYITDFTGKVLMRPGSLNKKGKLKVDLGSYPSGTYLVKYFTEDKGWGAEKVVLMH